MEDFDVEITESVKADLEICNRIKYGLIAIGSALQLYLVIAKLIGWSAASWLATLSPVLTVAGLAMAVVILCVIAAAFIDPAGGDMDDMDLLDAMNQTEAETNL